MHRQLLPVRDLGAALRLERRCSKPASGRGHARGGKRLALGNLGLDVCSHHVHGRRSSGEERIILRFFYSLCSEALGFLQLAPSFLCNALGLALAGIKECCKLLFQPLDDLVALFDQRLVSAIDLPASFKVRAFLVVARGVDLLCQLAAITDMIPDELRIAFVDLGDGIGVGFEARQHLLVRFDIVGAVVSNFIGHLQVPLQLLR